MFKTDWLIFALSVFKEINDALLLCTKVELQVRVFENKIVPYQDAVIGGARIEKKSLFHGTLLLLALCFITTISPNTCSVQKTTVRHFSCSLFCFVFFLPNQICTTPRWRREYGAVLNCLACYKNPEYTNLRNCNWSRSRKVCSKFDNNTANLPFRDPYS